MQEMQLIEGDLRHYIGDSPATVSYNISLQRYVDN